jgi:hypothetical protein
MRVRVFISLEIIPSAHKTQILWAGKYLNSFNYLRNLISYEKEVDIDNKMNNYMKITGIINDMFRPQKTLNKTRIKLYNTLVLPAVLHGCENWTIRATDTRRKTAGYSWTDYKINAENEKELNIATGVDKILVATYQLNAS